MLTTRRRYVNIKLTRYKRKGKSDVALMLEQWELDHANGKDGFIGKLLPFEFLRVHIVGWLFFCYIQIGLGLVVLLSNITTSAHMLTNEDFYLFFQRTYHETTHLLIFASSLLLIAIGITGIYLAYWAFPKYHLKNIHCGFMISFVCTYGAILFCIAISDWPDRRSYIQNLESDSFVKSDQDDFRNLWSNRDWDDNIWDSLQTDRQCCGYRSYNDWLLSPCQCIPVSCCNRKHHKECVQILESPKSNNTNRRITDEDDMRYIATLIWSEGCMEKLQDKLNSEKCFWIWIPVVTIIIQYILMVHHGWMGKRMLEYITTIPGARVQTDVFEKRFDLLKDYETLKMGLIGLDDGYEIVFKDSPFRTEDFVPRNSKMSIIVHGPDEYSSVEVIPEYDAEDFERLLKPKPPAATNNKFTKSSLGYESVLRRVPGAKVTNRNDETQVEIEPPASDATFTFNPTQRQTDVKAYANN